MAEELTEKDKTDFLRRMGVGKPKKGRPSGHQLQIRSLGLGKKHEMAKKMKKKYSPETEDWISRHNYARLHKKKTGYSLKEEELSGEK